jgi:hypothetical protein
VRSKLSSLTTFPIATCATAALRLLAVCCATSAASAAGLDEVGGIALVSATASGQPRGGYEPCGISADGQVITFHSESKALVPNDTNGITDVFMKDLRTGAVQRVSTSSTGAQWTTPAACKQVTPDGRYVLMQRDGEVLLKDVQTGTVTTVSPAVNAIEQNTGYSAGSVSDDGQLVAFVTVPTQTYLGGYQWVNNVPARIMLRHLGTGALTTLDTDNGRTADGEIILGHLNARLSPDGQRVAFVSSASTLVAADTNQSPDVFVRHLATGSTTLATSSSSGVPMSGRTPLYKVEWANNAVLQFDTASVTSLGPTGEYLKNLDTGALQLLLEPADGDDAVVSADLTKVVFGRLYGSGFDRRIFVRDLATGAEQVVSSSASGKPGTGNANVGLIARDGSHVVFNANSSNLVRPRPPAGSYQVYVKTIDTP